MIPTTGFRKHVLAIAWDESSLYYIRAKLSGKRIHVEECDAVEADGESNVDWSKLSRGTTVLCAIARSQVDVLELNLPPASPAELPSFVRNEVQRQLTDLTDECTVDFVKAASTTEGAEGSTVTAFALRSERKQAIEARNRSSGIKADHIVIRALATASLFRRMVGSSQRGRCLLITPLGQSIDISVFDHGKVVFTRSVRAETTHADAIVSDPVIAELRRTLLVADRDDGRVEHIYMFSDSSESTIADLAEQLELPVSELDPFEGTTGIKPGEMTHRFAPLMGMVKDYASGKIEVDFLHPRQPPSNSAAWKKIAFYATAAAVAIAAVIYTLGSDLSAAARELKAAQAEIAKQEKFLNKLQKKASVAKAIDQWESSEIVVLDELRDLSLRFPSGDQAIARGFNSTISNQRMSITMPILAADAAMYSDFEDLMRADHRSIQNRRFSQEQNQKPYTTSFQSSIQVVPQDKSKYRESDELAVRDDTTEQP